MELNSFGFFGFRNKLSNYFIVIITFSSKYAKPEIYRKYQVHFPMRNKLFKHLYSKYDQINNKINVFQLITIQTNKKLEIIYINSKVNAIINISIRYKFRN